MLDRYKQIKDQFLLQIEALDEFCRMRQSTATAENLKEVRVKLAENRFHLVVLGQFKRGKSTFINSILGDKVLPTSVVPLTSIVTLLKYGDKEQIEVIFNDQSTRPITRDELPEYVTEKGNPKNQKNVKQVEIALPSQYLKDGVYLIDTPGVGSTFENNTEMTYNFLPKVDAALFLLAVDPPISHSELAFLNDVQNFVQKIFFIQNKIDYLSDEERQESTEFSKRVIEEALGRDGIEIYPLSAKVALEGKVSGDQELLEKSRLPEFDRVLSEFLMKAKGKTVLESAVRSAKKLLSDEELAIQLEAQAVATPLEVLEKKIATFQEKMEEIKQDREDTRYYFDGEIQRVIDMLDRDLERLKQKEIPRLLEGLEKIGQENKDKPVGEYVKLMEQALHDGIVRTFDEWVMKEEDRLNEHYSKISKRFSERTNEVIDAIVEASTELFDIKLERFRSDEAIVSESSLYYMVGEPPKFFDLEGAFDFFSQKILPTKLSKGRVLKDIRKRLPREIDKNCGRVRWDFMDRVKRSFLNFRWELNQKIDATEQSIKGAIEKAVEMKKKSASELEAFRAKVDDQMRRLEHIKKSLVKLEEAISEL
ncbi:MAG TPA: dynamin [Desulfobacterales bacterium]|nr:dynamin [Desulfobacterales bacterium]